MKPASVASRVAAFWLDLLIQFTVIAGSARLVWTLLPATQVPLGGMTFYRPGDFRNFFISAGLSLAFIAYYQGSLDPTPGQRLARVRVARPDGSPLTRLQRSDRFWRLVFKCFLVFFGGPFLAALGGGSALSLIFLFLPLAGLLVLSALAWTDPEGAGPLERRGEYRFFAVE